ncbi:MAG: DHH family phosphoesterase [Xanthomonadaceae bacterium]|nr:DHH family phosphoesterase [Xanthomonadaceae bacterium]
MIRTVQVRRRPENGHAAGCSSTIVARLLGARGAPKSPDYSLRELTRPTLGGLETASRILADAIERDKTILIVGDFDADGATGTALAVRGLRGLGARNVQWRMPDRVRHGYGLGPKLAEECLVLKPDVLVTVDQGISSHAGIERVRAAGVEVIVTDHHLPGLRLPDASAIVNPNCPGDPYPSRHLAGVGVMFYVLAALRGELRRRGRSTNFRLDALLDLVALGTVADLVQLDENNRRMVYQGLKRIRAHRCAPGIVALLEVAGRNLSHITAADLGFIAGPRLNAAGRLDDISVGIRCLLADDADTAMQLAGELDRFNRERQSLQAEMTEKAIELADAVTAKLERMPGGLCLYAPDWHPGVVGLVASRICEKTQRPVVAFADQPRLSAFQQAFDEHVARFKYPADEVLSDGELPARELTLETALAISDAGPWGQGWEEPLFDGRFTVLDRRVVGGSHLKLSLEAHGGGPVIEAIAFRAGDLCHQEITSPLHVTYRLEINRWRGNTTPQLNIQHLVEAITSS